MVVLIQYNMIFIKETDNSITVSMMKIFNELDYKLVWVLHFSILNEWH